MNKIDFLREKSHLAEQAGAARQLTNFTTNGVHNFAFSTDGSRLYVVRAYQINDVVLIKNFR